MVDDMMSMNQFKLLTRCSDLPSICRNIQHANVKVPQVKARPPHYCFIRSDQVLSGATMNATQTFKKGKTSPEPL